MKSNRAARYSGTPLAKKLGITESSRVVTIGAPENYLQLLEPLPPGAVFGTRIGATVNLVHLFVSKQEVLAKHLGMLRQKLKPEAVAWVSWPKRASKVPTDISDNTIRDVALPLGFVDVKICAVSEVW